MRDEPQGVCRGFRDTGRQPSGPQGPGGKVCVQIEKTGAVPYGGVPLSVVRSGNMKVKQAQERHRAIGYCRVSTADQADFGVSLDAQTEKIRVWSVANGYELADVLVDRGLSGGRCDNRPALQEALKAVSRGDSLVVYSLSRLARSTRDTLMIAESLERKGADLVSLSERLDTTTSAGKMLFRMLAVLSEFERDVISERTSMAMEQLRRSGKYLGGFDPYGFRCVEGELEAIPEEQRVIQMVQRLRGEGQSLGSIGKRLLETGITTRTGKPFQPVQIARILKASA
jgi:DNA invertase Pin-like site-specific DNA recombinase